MKKICVIAVAVLSELYVVVCQIALSDHCLIKPLSCDVQCQYGYQRASGICACVCYDPCKGAICNSNEACIVQWSENVLIGRCRHALDQCPYGVAVNHCAVSPCLLAPCSVDRSVICIPDYCGRCSAHYFERSSGRDVTLSRCNRISSNGPQTKPGTCPTLAIGFCLIECNTDADCEGPKKCCSNGCGRICVSGVIEKPGACPSPAALGQAACHSDCQSDADCDGARKCCFNGCASVCVESTRREDSSGACAKLRAAIEALPTQSVLDGYVPSCEPEGRFSRVQCDRRVCWCVDRQGHEIFGTRSPINRRPDCENPITCQYSSVCNRDSCPFGFKTDENGCPKVGCQCVDYCHGIQCPHSFETCRMVHTNIDCTRGNQPGCIPLISCVANPCPAGPPQTDASNGITVICNHSSPVEGCDANHWCHMIGFSGGGLCCPLPSTAVRSGHCPSTNPSPSGQCAMECMVDSDCAADQKCCYNGCGMSCTRTANSSSSVTVAVATTTGTRKGVCPSPPQEEQPPTGKCIIDCQSDSNCGDDEMCCKYGCSYRCTRLSVTGSVEGQSDRTTAVAIRVAGSSSTVSPVPTSVKVGECPALSNVHVDADQCYRTCQSDNDCPNVKKCCFTGCGTRCMHPSTGPVCIHMAAAMEALATSNPGLVVPKCLPDGRFEDIQCSNGPEVTCWCVDAVTGVAIAGTSAPQSPQCQQPRQCPKIPCQLHCRSGYKMGGDGCFLCHCLDPCESIKCARPSEVCVATLAHCQSSSQCPAVPRCVVNSCPSGSPAKDPETGQFVSCESSNPCPPGFWCHNIGFQGSGVCCPFSVRQVHSGQCPATNLVQLGSGGACFNECLVDDDCSDIQKCCFNGCGLSCIAPSPNAATPIQFAETSPAKDIFTTTFSSTINSTFFIPTSTSTSAHSAPSPDQKIGQCPTYTPIQRTRCVVNVAECSSDAQCTGTRKCCNDGCAKRCLYPAVTTACLHARAAFEQLQQGSGNAGNSNIFPECNETGDYKAVQCDSNKQKCWCVDSSGFEIPGTRVEGNAGTPDCEKPVQCPRLDNCSVVCPAGKELDNRGCQTCRCRNPCSGVQCTVNSHICVVASVDCSEATLCPPVPRCVVNACPHGTPILNASSLDVHRCNGSGSCQSGGAFCRLLKDSEGYCCPGPEAPPRPGRCPNVHLSSIGSCKVECRQDSDCRVNKKCCYNGCGMSCMSTVEDDFENEARQCPGALSPLGHCVVECQTDQDCRPDYMCCVNGCSRICTYPVQQGNHSAPPRQAAGEAKVGICQAQQQNDSNCDANIIPECVSDKDCNGSRKCCNDGCVKRCLYPTITTGCLHLQAALEKALYNSFGSSAVIGQIPVPQCGEGGQFERIQCHNGTGHCWCVNGDGQEIPGTRTLQASGQPLCEHPRTCSKSQCSLQCPLGYMLDENGCETCQCYDPCQEIHCPFDFQLCRLAPVQCTDQTCRPVPRCVPNVCAVGEPLRNDGTWELVRCDPELRDSCPPDFACHVVGFEDSQGFCCPTGTGIAPAAIKYTCRTVPTISTIPTWNTACQLQCKTAADCAAGRVCCFNGCGLSCVKQAGENAGATTHTGDVSIISDAVDTARVGSCPPLSTTNVNCSNRCNADQDCTGAQLCCSSACGRLCLQPYNTTACVHWNVALEALSLHEGQFIPKCDDRGYFQPIQCHSNYCWCVDTVSGNEIPGTRRLIDDQVRSRRSCSSASLKCNITCQSQCQHGWKLDDQGCPLEERCECRDPCDGISCPIADHICITEKRQCVDTPCPPVPTCKPNPCGSLEPVRDNSTGKLLICNGKFSNECGLDVCKLIPNQTFGLCCEAQNINSSTSVQDRKPFPDPPTFDYLRQVVFALESDLVPENNNDHFKGAFLDVLRTEYGLRKEDIQNLRFSNRLATVSFRGIGIDADDLTRHFNFTFNGTTYLVKAQIPAPSRPYEQLAPLTPTSEENMITSASFIGLVASCAIFAVIVVIVMLAAYLIMKRRKRNRKIPRMTVSLPSYSAPLYTHSSSEIGKPIMETSTDSYTQSLPRKMYTTGGTSWQNNPTPRGSTRTVGNDNQLFY